MVSGEHAGELGGEVLLEGLQADPVNLAATMTRAGAEEKDQQATDAVGGLEQIAAVRCANEIEGSGSVARLAENTPPVACGWLWKRRQIQRLANWYGHHVNYRGRRFYSYC